MMMLQNEIFWEGEDKERIIKWDIRFLRQCKDISTWSKDPSTQVGSIAVSGDKRIIQTGYNGFPSRLKDHEHLYNDRLRKLKRIQHAEKNVILNSANFGVPLRNSCFYIYGLVVCSCCALDIISVGAVRVVVKCTDKVKRKRWEGEWQEAQEMFEEAGISYHEYE